MTERGDSSLVAKVTAFAKGKNLRMRELLFLKLTLLLLLCFQIEESRNSPQ